MIQSESVLSLSSDSSFSVSSCLSLTNLSAFSLHHSLPVANSLSLSLDNKITSVTLHVTANATLLTPASLNRADRGGSLSVTPVTCCFQCWEVRYYATL